MHLKLKTFINHIFFIAIIILFAPSVFSNTANDRDFILEPVGSDNSHEFGKGRFPSKNSILDLHESDNSKLVGKGIIQAKSTIEDLPAFRVYFNGNVATSDDCGFFSFPVEDADIYKYRLVITRRLEHVFDKQNTINNFKVIPDKDYMCYTFKKHGRYGSWVKKIKPLNHKNFALPKNSIVLLMSPKYVDHIEEWDVELPKNVIKMPKIVLRSNIKENELKRVAAKSLLCLEDTVFHEKVGRQNNQSDAKSSKVKVTLP